MSAMNFVVGIIDKRSEHVREVDPAVAPNAAAMPTAVRRIPSSICFMVSLLTVRTVPRITAVCGMTFYASPA
jgi:hypothetical protein